MCQSEKRDSCCCEQSEKMKGKPKDCTPERIKECHGDAQNHPCEKQQA